MPIIILRFVSYLSVCDIEAGTLLNLSVCSADFLNICDKDVVYAVLLFQLIIDVEAIG